MLKCLRRQRAFGNPQCQPGLKDETPERDRPNQKKFSELKEYEGEILYPLATQQVEIDLDEGVKVNYYKFGKALKYMRGLSA